MRKLISFLIITFALCMFSGCGMFQKPETTVSEYIKAATAFDLEKMNSKIAPSNATDKKDISDIIENDEDEYQKYIIDYFKSNAAKITYKIKNTKIDNDSAVVTVDFKYIDGSPLIKASIAEAFSKIMPLAFSGVEVSDDESSQFFITAMETQRKTIKEKYTSKTIDIKCVKIDKQWYIEKSSDELMDVLTSNFISAGKDIDKSFNSDENSTKKTPNEMMSDIKDYVISDLWNDGFIDIKYYLETGKGSYGQDLDIELTKSELSKAMKKKPEYDKYINGLGDEYADIKNIWSKLSSEADNLYAQIESNATAINTDIFNQYMDVFSNNVEKLN